MQDLKASPYNITFIQAHAPTTDNDVDDIEDFYDQLQKVIDQTPKKDILVVQGDWNAKIGEDVSKNWKGTCGQYCNPETNERGLRLLEFASCNKHDEGGEHIWSTTTEMLDMAQPRRRLPQSDLLHHCQTTLPVKCEHCKDQELSRS